MQLLRDPNFALPAETLLKIWQGVFNAVRWHLTDCSARYASNFREGVFAISLVRSLAAAGEVLADYLRHVGQVIKAFTNCRFSIDDCQLNSSESVSSESVSSEFGVRSSELGSSVSENAELRTQNSELVNSEPRTPNPELPQPATPHSITLTLASALAQVSWRRLRASRQHALWERREVVRLFRALARERERGPAITPERLTWLAEDLHKVLFYSEERFSRQVRRLNRRFEALAARLLQELGLPPTKLHLRPSPAVEVATAESLPEALGNPEIPPARVRRAAKPRQPQVKPAKEWQRSDYLRYGQTRRSHAAEEREFRERFTDRFGNLIPGAFRRQLEPEAGEPRAERSEGGHPPAPAPETGDRQLFVDLVAQALGPNPSLKPGDADPIPGGLAEALWNRLEFTREHAEDERETFRAMLDGYCDSLDARPSGTQRQETRGERQDPESVNIMPPGAAASGGTLVSRLSSLVATPVDLNRPRHRAGPAAALR